MVENVAATVWLAFQIGSPEVLPDDAVEKLTVVIATAYGQ